MSVKEVEDLVFPIVTERQAERGELISWSRCSAIKDHRITDFLGDGFDKEFGLLGETGGRCGVLKYISVELDESGPPQPEDKVERILDPHINLWLIDAQTMAYPARRLPTLGPAYSKANSAKRGLA